jgi:hypothetical protein
LHGTLYPTFWVREPVVSRGKIVRAPPYRRGLILIFRIYREIVKTFDACRR